MSEAQRGSCQVTVAVVSWNTRALLADCLSSLHQDAHSGLAEVWVIDNASTDGSAELVRERYPWVRLIAAEENLGFGRGVNEIAALTSTPWLAPANADVRLAPGALRSQLAAGARHPEAAVIAPRLILPDGSTQHSVYPFPSIPFTLAYVSGATRASVHLARHWCIERGFDPERAREVAWAVGAFTLVRRSAWLQVGGFDQDQWMYAEDLDLGWRLRRAGWRTRYVPEARVYHAESAATRQAWGDARHHRWHASTYAWMARRRGWRIARIVAAINVIGFTARALVCHAAALAGSAPSAQARNAAINAARAHSIGLRRRRMLERVR